MMYGRRGMRAETQALSVPMPRSKELRVALVMGQGAFAWPPGATRGPSGKALAAGLNFVRHACWWCRCPGPQVLHVGRHLLWCTVVRFYPVPSLQSVPKRRLLARNPCASWSCMQVLHVARNLLWYTAVRPARLGGWAGVELNAQVLFATCLVLAVAASPRGGRLWAAWRRWAGGGLLQCTYCLWSPLELW